MELVKDDKMHGGELAETRERGETEERDARNAFTVLLSVNVQSPFGIRQMCLDHGNRFSAIYVVDLRAIERIVNSLCEAGYDRAQSGETRSSTFFALRKGFLSCLQVYL